MNPKLQPGDLAKEGLPLTGLLKKAASDFPSWSAVSACGEFDLTYVRLQELVDHAAALVAAYGISASDVVVLAFPNTVEVFTAAPLNPNYTAKEFKFYLSDLEPKLLLTPQEGNRWAQSAASKLNIHHPTAKLHSTDSKISLFDRCRAEPWLNVQSCQ
ncbi:hypothetical protein ACJRO7_026900 [Eucalyptus globulus]|uniref:AMP-dependent synthetase/ligase domain-containing protein n=1 Tax=Eucalyptus globulus TaxID=34317 RepID=A0ABD3JS16_EUCGL